MNDEIRRVVESATVRMLGKGGQGVLVPGELILTAAHCVDFYTTGGMALGDVNLELVRTATGIEFNTNILAVEPVSDTAVLGPADDQEMWEDYERFMEFVDSTTAIELSLQDRPFDEWFSAYVFSHDTVL